MKEITLSIENLPKDAKGNAIQEISVGEFRAEFKKGGRVKTASREFADLLISNYGLTAIDPDAKAAEPETKKAKGEK